MLTHEFSITEVPGAGVVEEPLEPLEGQGPAAGGARAQEARRPAGGVASLQQPQVALTRGVQLESLVLETQGCVQGVSVGGLLGGTAPPSFSPLSGPLLGL